MPPTTCWRSSRRTPTSRCGCSTAPTTPRSRSTSPTNCCTTAVSRNHRTAHRNRLGPRRTARPRQSGRPLRSRRHLGDRARRRRRDVDTSRRRRHALVRVGGSMHVLGSIDMAARQDARRATREPGGHRHVVRPRERPPGRRRDRCPTPRGRRSAGPGRPRLGRLRGIRPARAPVRRACSASCSPKVVHARALLPPDPAADHPWANWMFPAAVLTPDRLAD